MTRIRVEMDVPDEWNLDEFKTILGRTVKSVEVVEPKRYTELVLRHDEGEWGWRAGDRAAVVDPAETKRSVRPRNEILDQASGWTVVSCEVRTEEPE